MANYGIFSHGDAQKLAEGYRQQVGKPRKILGVPERVSRLVAGGGGECRDAQLTSTLVVATNAKTGASTATAKFLIPDPDNPGNLKDGDTFTVTNRSLGASGVAGDYLVVAPIGGEWRPVWVDC